MLIVGFIEDAGPYKGNRHMSETICIILTLPNILKVLNIETASYATVHIYFIGREKIVYLSHSLGRVIDTNAPCRILSFIIKWIVAAVYYGLYNSKKDKRKFFTIIC